MVAKRLGRAIGLGGFVLMIIGFAPLAYGQEQPVTHDEVERAIYEIVQYLYEAQDEETGAWFGEYHADATVEHRNNWGPTALALLALITANERPQEPAITRGLERLEASQITGVYAMSVRLQVWSHLADDERDYARLMRGDSAALDRSWYGFSRFNYTVTEDGRNTNNQYRDRINRRVNGGRIDNSVTQFGIYGLWHGSRHGARLRGEFWEQVVENFLEMQQEDGGWAYTNGPNTNQSMTLSALTCLYIAQQEMYRGRRSAEPRVQEAIDRGVAYLTENFDISQAAVSGPNYLWYSYERFAQLSGRRQFAENIPFEQSARRIAQRQAAYAQAVHRGAFDLMVLALGNRPIWINKLQIEGVNWNNRPNDIYYVNDFIQSQDVYDLNWQIVGFDSPANAWDRTPILWISSDQEIQWTPVQVERIRTYLDNGGTLIANPETGDRDGRFAQSIRALAEQLYPGQGLEPLAADHRLVTATGGELELGDLPGVDVLSDGERVIIVMPREDWGFTFQMDRTPDPDRRAAWRYILNLYTLSEQAGRIIPRLPLALPDPDAQDDGGLF